MDKTIQQTIIDLKIEIGEIELNRRKLKDFVATQLDPIQRVSTYDEIEWMNKQLSVMSQYQECLVQRIYLLKRKLFNDETN